MSSTNERIICVPGQVLCASSNDHVAGQGTFERMGYIYASLAGVVKVEKKLEINIVQVQSLKEQSTVPSPGDIVTARVLIVKSRQCMCEIKCIGDIALTRPFRAVLRQEDVRATEKDRVKMYESFAPGDIILARVLPIMDVHTYQLSTAENELGVVISHSEAGVPMVPISWTEMQCPVNFTKKLRKVAKVIPENIDIDMEDNTETEKKPST
ncbi:Hypothetical predicted protein [Cloeon dipterum]|uniref:S1 motif domain-containing protein n=1 Tax=Cloeon dipterum TaxID=197152 RepID=A0A8S1D816_9INSE|nr:Hypothetical predicted protein [Cloeon dipterum]